MLPFRIMYLPGGPPNPGGLFGSAPLFVSFGPVFATDSTYTDSSFCLVMKLQRKPVRQQLPRNPSCLLQARQALVIRKNVHVEVIRLDPIRPSDNCVCAGYTPA